MIIVTGAKGELSVAIKDYLAGTGLAESRCLSVRGREWEEYDFSGVDTIVHVAGIVPKPGVNSEEYYKVNSQLTRRLAYKAKEEGVSHFIYISSMAVYGINANLDPEKGLLDENSVCNPVTDYGKSKLEAEKALHDIEDNNFKVAIIRVPSIYSTKKREYFSQYQLICSKFRCVPLAFRKCFRSAITVENLCELLRLVVENKTSGTLCPDNGPTSASEYCAMIHPEMHKSRFVGFIIEKCLRWHPMVQSLFGALAYTPEASNLFGGTYRISK